MVERIKYLAKQYRDAIDAALDNREFRKPRFSNFPVDCCDLACDLLGQYLSENGIETYQIRGECNFDYQQHHVWLVHDEIVIDITGDQFAGKLGYPLDIPKVHVGPMSETQSLFCIDRERWENTNYNDATRFDPLTKLPSARQKYLIELDAIIRLHLHSKKHLEGRS